jgi:microsomal dipeptidase-like Zn-dependent dipeptidase
VQTVAFASYLNANKNRAMVEVRNKLYADIADDMGIEMMSFREAFTLPEAARDAYIAKYRAIQKAAEPRLEAEVYSVAPPVDVKDFVDHIDYIVDFIGLDHVGISSDFDGGGGIYGWNDASETHNVTIELVRRGYTEEQIGKLWSGNLLRVLDEVQAVSAELQAAQ